jgi:hypothetical protein
MQCRHCEYLLFNLTQPVCPECGRPFEIEWYRFEPGSVSFNCPHCDQEYYGNDERGLPYPRQFTCVNCHQPITLQQMRVVPKDPETRGVLGDLSPWDRRRQLGLPKAWWDTFVMTLIKPGQFFRMHSGRSIKEAWLFAVIANYMAMVMACLLQIILMLGLDAAMRTMGPAGPAGAAPMPFVPLILLYGAMGLVGPLIAPLITGGIWACAIQMALFFLVPDRRSLSHTFRTVLYSMGPYALGVIPFCGGYVGGIWVVVTAISGIKEVHRTDGWRAAIAVLWPPIALIGLYVTLVFFLVFL